MDVESIMVAPRPLARITTFTSKASTISNIIASKRLYDKLKVIIYHDLEIITDIKSFTNLYPLWEEDCNMRIDGKSSKSYLYITKKFDVKRFCIRWKCYEKSYEWCSILVLNDKYIINGAQDKNKSMEIWGGFLQLKDGKGEEYEYTALTNAALKDRRYIDCTGNDELLCIYEDHKYTGDYSFHFGHFFKDVLPVIMRYKAIDRSGKKKYILNKHLGFHNELLQTLNLEHLIKERKDDLTSQVWINKEEFYYTWIENYGTTSLCVAGHNFGGFCHINKILGPQIEVVKEYDKCARYNKYEFRGLLFKRGKNVPTRWLNYEEIIGNHTIKNSNSNEEVKISIDLVSPEELGIFGRINTALSYDFIVGPPGGHMIPTNFYSEITHFYAVPFIPTLEMEIKFLPIFRYNKFEWVSDKIQEEQASTESVNQEVFDKLWFDNYELDAEEILKQIAFKLLQKL